jgi:hypothetical protein
MLHVYSTIKKKINRSVVCYSTMNHIIKINHKQGLSTISTISAQRIDTSYSSCSTADTRRVTHSLKKR